MRFTRQDAITFLLGWGAALAWSAGEILAGLDGQSFTTIDWGFAGILGNVIVGSLSATGRYVVTRIPDVLALVRKTSMGDLG